MKLFIIFDYKNEHLYEWRHVIKIVILTAIVFCKSVQSQDNTSVHKYLFLNTGVSIPIYGHFADGDSGFKKAFGFNSGYVKDIDDVLSWGFFASNYQYYKNRDINIKLKFFSFTPVLFSWLGFSEKKYYTYVGAGMYHWSQPKTSTFDSSSSTEAGLRFGLGFNKKLYKKLNWGGNIEWNHIFDMKGKNFDVGSANTLSLSISVIMFH